MVLTGCPRITMVWFQINWNWREKRGSSLQMVGRQGPWKEGPSLKVRLAAGRMTLGDLDFQRMVGCVSNDWMAIRRTPWLVFLDQTAVSWTVLRSFPEDVDLQWIVGLMSFHRTVIRQMARWSSSENLEVKGELGLLKPAVKRLGWLKSAVKEELWQLRQVLPDPLCELWRWIWVLADPLWGPGSHDGLEWGQGLGWLKQEQGLLSNWPGRVKHELKASGLSTRAETATRPILLTHQLLPLLCKQNCLNCAVVTDEAEKDAGTPWVWHWNQQVPAYLPQQSSRAGADPRGPDLDILSTYTTGSSFVQQHTLINSNCLAPHPEAHCWLWSQADAANWSTNSLFIWLIAGLSR